MHKVETKNENERMSRHRVHIYIDTLMIRRFTQMQRDIAISVLFELDALQPEHYL